MSKKQDQLNKLMERILQDGYEKADAELKALYKLQKEKRDSVLTWLSAIYGKYAVDGIIKLNTVQNTKFKAEAKSMLQKMAEELGAKEVQITNDILLAVGMESFNRTTYTIESGLSKVLKKNKLDDEDITRIINQSFEGKKFSTRIWTNQKSLINKLSNEIDQAIKQGKTIDQITRVISNDFATSAYNARRITHTELARVQIDTQVQAFKQSGVVEKVRYSATLDGKTSEICQGLDGKVFPVDDAPKPPLHPFCRSTLLAVIDDWKPMSRKDNETKGYIPYKTYEQWLENR